MDGEVPVAWSLINSLQKKSYAIDQFTNVFKLNAYILNEASCW